MNLLRYLIPVGVLLTAVHAYAASTFEGNVDFSISSGGRGGPQSLSYAIKGQSLRIEMNAEGQQIASIIDGAKQEMLIMMPEQKMYMVMPFKQGLETAAKAGGVDSDAKIEHTGKTETILGYKCEQMIITDKNQISEVWLATGLGTFMGLGNNANPLARGKRSAATTKWEEALKGKSGFPLRVITKDTKNKELFKMEVTKITPASLPASLFQPPAGYQKFSMPDLGGFNPFKKG
jgi:hypothetical protein